MVTARNNPAARTRRAFSLLELVVVVVIVAVASAIAMPRYTSSLSRYRAELAAERLAADLRHAQETARRTSHSVTAVIDTVNDTLRLVGVSDIDHASLEYKTDFSADPYHADVLSASFGGGNTITYDGYGIPDKSGTAVVQVGDVTKTVVLNSYTQKATVE